MKEFVKKTLNFMDGNGHVYRINCNFKLVDGIFRIYDCGAINAMKNCSVSYGPNNEVFIQPKALDDGSDSDKNPYREKSVKKFCAICTMKQNCGR